MGFDAVNNKIQAYNIGSLFGHNLIPEEPLLEAMWGSGRVCWICLKDNIMIERDKRKVKRYMDNFQKFMVEIEYYRCRQKPMLEPVEPVEPY